MITYVHGNLFQSPAQVLVNTVNTVGVMGKGIALEFKKLYPGMFTEYQNLCETGERKVGKLFLYQSPNKWILNFPTKIHWKNPSRIEYIQKGLQTFSNLYNKVKIHSIAFPALGCGNGELDFTSQVQPIMERFLSESLIDVFIYPDQYELSLPEHRQLKDFKNWLRGEPKSLAFVEVWDDIKALLNEKNNFSTLGKGVDFVIKIEDENSIRIKTSKEVIISYDELQFIWQQLRNFGFISRELVSGIGETIYYLFPLLENLPYIQSVKISSSYDQSKNSSYALQLTPLGYPSEKDNIQLPLFTQINI